MRIARQIPRDSLEVLHDDKAFACCRPFPFIFFFIYLNRILFICIHFVRTPKELEQMQECRVSVSQDIFINLSLKLSSNLQGRVPHTAVGVGDEVFRCGCS